MINHYGLHAAREEQPPSFSHPISPPPPPPQPSPHPPTPTAPCPEPRFFPHISSATSCLLATCIQCHQLQRTPLLRLRSQMPAEWQEEDVQDEKCMWWRAMKEMWKETPQWALHCFVQAIHSAESRSTARTSKYSYWWKAETDNNHI